MNFSLYEILYIIDATLDESEISRLEKGVKDTILEDGGEIKKESNWGRRKLAYEIKKKKEGIYVNLEFNASSETPNKITQFVQTNAGILRHLTIQVPKAKIIQEKKDAEKRQREIEEAQREREAALAAQQRAAEAAEAEARTQESVEQPAPEETTKTTEAPPTTPPQEQEPAVESSPEPEPKTEEK